MEESNMDNTTNIFQPDPKKADRDNTRSEWMVTPYVPLVMKMINKVNTVINISYRNHIFHHAKSSSGRLSV